MLLHGSAPKTKSLVAHRNEKNSPVTRKNKNPRAKVWRGASTLFIMLDKESKEI
jgi:hypothetical protein